MPHPTWRHTCCELGRRTITGARECSYCGTPGKFDGWGLSVVEHWGHWQRATGLPPFGPGRLMREDLPIVRCRTCKGIGIFGTPDRGGPCPDCDGRGMWLDATEEEKAAILRRSRAAQEAERRAAQLRAAAEGDEEEVEGEDDATSEAEGDDR